MLTKAGYETAYPQDFRVYPRRRNGYVKPPGLLPFFRCKVLVRLAPEDFLTIRDVSQHIEGWKITPEGAPTHIPDSQMDEFLEAHSQWLVKRQKEAASANVGVGVGRGIKRRWMASTEALIKLRHMFDG